jgi:hypothetical protein
MLGPDALTSRSDLDAPMFRLPDALVSDYPTFPQADPLTRATMLRLPQTDTRKHLTDRLSDAPNRSDALGPMSDPMLCVRLSDATLRPSDSRTLL